MNNSNFPFDGEPSDVREILVRVAEIAAHQGAVLSVLVHETIQMWPSYQLVSRQDTLLLKIFGDWAPSTSN